MSTTTLGPKGKNLLKVIVSEIKSGRIEKDNPQTFIPYSEAMMLLELPDPYEIPGRRLQNEGLTELNEWTKVTPGIPHVAGLIINKETHLPSEGYPKSHDIPTDSDWTAWWLKESSKAIDFDWSPYL